MLILELIQCPLYWAVPEIVVRMRHGLTGPPPDPFPLVAFHVQAALPLCGLRTSTQAVPVGLSPGSKEARSSVVPACDSSTAARETVSTDDPPELERTDT